jgi:hypothetical protein
MSCKKTICFIVSITIIFLSIYLLQCYNKQRREGYAGAEAQSKLGIAELEAINTSIQLSIDNLINQKQAIVEVFIGQKQANDNLIINSEPYKMKEYDAVTNKLNDEIDELKSQMATVGNITVDNMENVMNNIDNNAFNPDNIASIMSIKDQISAVTEDKELYDSKFSNLGSSFDASSINIDNLYDNNYGFTESNNADNVEINSLIETLKSELLLAFSTRQAEIAAEVETQRGYKDDAERTKINSQNYQTFLTNELSTRSEFESILVDYLTNFELLQHGGSTIVQHTDDTDAPSPYSTIYTTGNDNNVTESHNGSTIDIQQILEFKQTLPIWYKVSNSKDLLKSIYDPSSTSISINSAITNQTSQTESHTHGTKIISVAQIREITDNYMNMDKLSEIVNQSTTYFSHAVMSDAITAAIVKINNLLSTEQSVLSNQLNSIKSNITNKKRDINVSSGDLIINANKLNDSMAENITASNSATTFMTNRDNDLGTTAYSDVSQELSLNNYNAETEKLVNAIGSNQTILTDINDYSAGITLPTNTIKEASATSLNGDIYTSSAIITDDYLDNFLK